MKKTFLLTLVVALVVLGWLTTVEIEEPEPALQKNVEVLGEQEPPSLKTHSSVFDSAHFYSGIDESIEVGSHKSIRGGVVPHHLVASGILSGFFERLGQQKPLTVILLGPNHEGHGAANILTATFGWETPFGTIESNYEVIDRLLEEGFVGEDDEVVGAEHSMGGVMPYLAYYLPGAKVVPLIFSSVTSLEEVRQLSSVLRQVTQDERIVVVAPVDFSHYLSAQEAEERDEVTLQVMQNFDVERIMQLSNEYLDSPPAIAALLLTMQDLGTTKVDVFDHTSSYLLQATDPTSVTSYFGMVFTNN